MSWRDRITTQPTVCHGKPCFAGTRVMVSVVLDNLASGRSIEQVLADYPSVTREDVLAALAFAADLTRERDIPRSA
jgi:uncharacterized protein (DUF433 family)